MGSKFNLATGKRESRFYLKILAEPKWKSFGHQSLQVIRAIDGQGRSLVKAKPTNSYSSWNRARSNFLDFSDDWRAVSIPLASPDTKKLDQLALKLPVRIPVTRLECRLELTKDQKPKAVDLGDRVICIEAFVIRGRSITATVTTSGKNPGRHGTYEFFLEQNGAPVGTLYPRMSSSGASGMEMELSGNTQSKYKPDQPSKLLVVYPGKMKTHDFRFEFENLKLY